MSANKWCVPRSPACPLAAQKPTRARRHGPPACARAPHRRPSPQRRLRPSARRTWSYFEGLNPEAALPARREGAAVGSRRQQPSAAIQRRPLPLCPRPPTLPHLSAAMSPTATEVLPTPLAVPATTTTAGQAAPAAGESMAAGLLLRPGLAHFHVQAAGRAGGALQAPGRAGALGATPTPLRVPRPAAWLAGCTRGQRNARRWGGGAALRALPPSSHAHTPR